MIDFRIGLATASMVAALFLVILSWLLPMVACVLSLFCLFNDNFLGAMAWVLLGGGAFYAFQALGHLAHYTALRLFAPVKGGRRHV